MRATTWLDRGRISLVHAVITLLAFIPTPTIAQSTDFSGDGFSELVLVSPVSPLSWQSIEVGSGTAAPLGELGEPGDHLVPGDWTKSGKPQIAVVHLNSSGTISWKVDTATGVIEKEFGQSGDTVVAAADFDSSGAADAVVVRRDGRKLRWVIAYDLLNGGSTTAEHLFGAAPDLPFFVNPDGQGPQFAALVRGKRGTAVRLLNPRTLARATINKFPKLANPTLAVAVPFAGTDGREIAAVIEKGASTVAVSLFDLNARTSSTVTIAASGETVVGNYLTDAGFEIGVQHDGVVTILNPFVGTEKVVTAVSDVLADHVNIISLGSTSDAPSPVPVPDPTLPTSLAAVCATTSAILPGELLIKSDPSNHIGKHDRRTTGYTVVCARDCPFNVRYAQFFYSDGTLAGVVAKYGNFHGNGRPRLYGAVGDAPQHFAAEISRIAATIGNGKLYLQMSQAISGPTTVCKAFDPTGRNGGL